MFIPNKKTASRLSVVNNKSAGSGIGLDALFPSSARPRYHHNTCKCLIVSYLYSSFQIVLRSARSFRRREGLSCRPRSRIPAPASPPGLPTCLKQLTLSRGFIVRLFLNHARYKTKSSPFWLHEHPPLTWPCPTVSSVSPSRREADVPPVIFPDLFLGSIPPL